MKHRIHFALLFLIVLSMTGFAQPNPVIDAFPKGSILYGNVSYNNDTVKKHMLDIYLMVVLIAVQVETA